MKAIGSPIQPFSLVEALVERLVEAIVSGALPPGGRLSEHGLAEQFGVSRGPLREAIRQLEGRKLIQRFPNLGARVTSLSDVDLCHLLVVREALEGVACRLAAERMSERDLRGLAELLDKHSSQETIRKGTGYYQEAKDFDFHFRIIQASANPRLIEMLCGELYDQLRIFRYKSSTKPGRAQQAFSEHQDILAALMAREPDRAEAAMRQHIRNARKHIEQHVLEADGKAAETTRVNTEPADTRADSTRMRPRGEWVAGKTSLLVGDRRRSKPG